jgi:hypothetical protein
VRECRRDRGLERQAALDRLGSAVETAAIKRVTDKVMPGGVPIGTRGNGQRVRELSGGVAAARALFDDLSVGGKLGVDSPDLLISKLPGNAEYITFRPASTSGLPALDINVPGIAKRAEQTPRRK